jgi:hypothetical protein
MVNIRATLARACEERVISDDIRRSLVQRAKALPYQERSWDRLLDGQPPLSGVEYEALLRWLSYGRVDQKQEDALMMLRRMSEEIGPHTPLKRVAFTFEHSSVWDDAVRRSHGFSSGLPGEAENLAVDSLLEELRLRGEETYRTSLGLAAGRLFALREARRHGEGPSESELRSTAATFRRRHGLLLPNQVDAWVAMNALDHDGYVALIAEEALLSRVEHEHRREMLIALTNTLRSSGLFPDLASAARRKRNTLAAAGLENPSLESCGLTEESLYNWYFRERLCSAVPDDIPATADRLGFKNEEAMRLAVLRERCLVEIEQRGHGLSQNLALPGKGHVGEI